MRIRGVSFELTPTDNKTFIKFPPITSYFQKKKKRERNPLLPPLTRPFDLSSRSRMKHSPWWRWWRPVRLRVCCVCCVCCVCWAWCRLPTFTPTPWRLSACWPGGAKLAKFLASSSSCVTGTGLYGDPGGGVGAPQV